jgi:uncharacterized membrane protein (UPF0127 family)
MGLMHRILAALLLLGLAFSACGGGDGNADADTATALPVIDLHHEGSTLRVEVAVTPEDRVRGLSGRDSLAEDAGMLFDLVDPRRPGFWMKDMRFPLDMVWIDERKNVVGVSANVEPQPGVPDSELRRYSPPTPVRYVLELNAGAAERLGLGAGDAVQFELP